MLAEYDNRLRVAALEDAYDWVLLELSRGSSPPETIRSLTALGDYLEVAEADYPSARRAYQEALASRPGDRRRATARWS